MTGSTMRAAVVVGFVVVLAGWPSGASGQTAAAHKDAGRAVKVTMTDGTTGKFRLVNLTASELVVQRDSAQAAEHIALSRVSAVRGTRPVHTILWAATFAAIAGPVTYGAAGGPDEGSQSTNMTLGFVVGGVAAGLGAWLGHTMDNRPSRGPLIYAAPKAPKKTVLISPTISRSRVGLGAVVRW